MRQHLMSPLQSSPRAPIVVSKSLAAAIFQITEKQNDVNTAYTLKVLHVFLQTLQRLRRLLLDLEYVQPLSYRILLALEVFYLLYVLRNILQSLEEKTITHHHIRDA